ncbi:MAG: class I SAM-dependent methyltransferase, partial [Sphingomonas sp.]
QALLSETVLTIIQVERDVFIPLRDWLLMSGVSEDFPRATAALAAQAALSGGAWPFSEVEGRALNGAGAIEAAYLPARPTVAKAGQLAWVSPVTREVAAQYEGWPYPAWKRAMAGRGESLREFIAALGPDAPQDMPEDAAILVAGCGTGHEPVLWARRFPKARITAIDLSAASIAYAEARAREAGVTNVSFEQRDLHDATGQFDIVLSSGVLHHLADPEAGWAAIAGVLKPGGAMRVQLYSKAARTALQPALDRIAPLLKEPMSDDLLRTVRERLSDDASVNRSPDFFSLGGVHDLLLHAHEDIFDVPRIRAAIDALGLTLLRFQLPTAGHRQRYESEHPEDPNFRDAAAWERIEQDDPMAFAGMHDFWCVKR